MRVIKKTILWTISPTSPFKDGGLIGLTHHPRLLKIISLSHLSKCFGCPKISDISYNKKSLIFPKTKISGCWKTLGVPKCGLYFFSYSWTWQGCSPINDATDARWCLLKTWGASTLAGLSSNGSTAIRSYANRCGSDGAHSANMTQLFWGWLASRKLTVRTWTWMVGRLVSFWGSFLAGAMLVSGSCAYFVRKIKFKLSLHMVLWLSEDGWRAVVKH